MWVGFLQVLQAGEPFAFLQVHDLQTQPPGNLSTGLALVVGFDVMQILHFVALALLLAEQKHFH